MGENNWQVGEKRYPGRWVFRKYIDHDFSKIEPSNLLIMVKSILDSIKNYFKPKFMDFVCFDKKELIEARIGGGNISPKRDLVSIFFNKNEDQLTKAINLFKGKDLILTHGSIKGETLLYVYDKNGNAKRCWKTNLTNFKKYPDIIPENNFLVFDIHGNLRRDERSDVDLDLETYSDIWLSKVRKVNDQTLLHYDNTELAKLNSKTLSFILKSIKEIFKPDEIETWSGIDQEACEKNLPNKLVTEKGFNQDRIKEIWTH